MKSVRTHGSSTDGVFRGQPGRAAGAAPAAAPAPLIAILAADDILRRRLRTLLTTDGFAIARATGLGDVPRVGREPQAVIVALGRSETASFEAVRRIRRSLPRALVLGISGETGGRVLREALAAGLDALVLESGLEVSLGPALRAALAGLVVVPREVRDHATGPILSGREKQVLALVVMGLSNREIGTSLFVAEATVKSHLSSAFRKLGVRTRNEACRLILDPSNRLGLGVLSICEEVPLVSQ